MRHWGNHSLYVIAAAVIAAENHDLARDLMRPLLRPPLAPSSAIKLHYRDLSPTGRRKAAETVSGIEATHLVVVGVPVNPRKQERARRKCLERLLIELDAWDVEQLLLETRIQTQNRLDIKLVSAVHAKRYISRRLWVDHRLPSTEPLLWIPDIVAGAVGDAREGAPEILDIFEHRVIEIEIPVR